MSEQESDSEFLARMRRYISAYRRGLNRTVDKVDLRRLCDLAEARAKAEGELADARQELELANMRCECLAKDNLVHAANALAEDKQRAESALSVLRAEFGQVARALAELLPRYCEMFTECGLGNPATESILVPDAAKALATPLAKAALAEKGERDATNG